jgi:hypothetical protein
MSVDVAFRTCTVGESLSTRLADALSVADGGFSVDPRTGFPVSEGFSVAIHPEREQQLTGRVRFADVKAYAFRNADLFAKRGVVYGGWRDPQTGVAFLDVSTVVATRAEAVSLARKHNQLAYFDFTAGRSVSV